MHTSLSSVTPPHSISDESHGWKTYKILLIVLIAGACICSATVGGLGLVGVISPPFMASIVLTGLGSGGGILLLIIGAVSFIFPSSPGSSCPTIYQKQEVKKATQWEELFNDPKKFVCLVRPIEAVDFKKSLINLNEFPKGRVVLTKIEGYTSMILNAHEGILSDGCSTNMKGIIDDSYSDELVFILERSIDQLWVRGGRVISEFFKGEAYVLSKQDEKFLGRGIISQNIQKVLQRDTTNIPCILN